MRVPKGRIVLVVVVVVLLAFVLLAPRDSTASGKAVEGAVNLNTAPVEVLSLLSGIGPAKARSIVAYRKRHPFRTIDELVRIKGIGRKMVRQLRPHLAVGGPTTAVRVDGPSPEPPPPPPKLAPPRPAVRLACVASAPRARSVVPARSRPTHGACRAAP